MKYIIITTLLITNFFLKAQLSDATLGAKLLAEEINLWNAPNDSTKLQCLTNKVILLKSAERYKEAILEVERSENMIANSELTLKLKYEKILLYFLTKQYQYVQQITITDQEIKQLNKIEEYKLMRLISLNESENWSLCKSELLKLSVNCDSLTLRNIYSLPLQYKYKDPEQCAKLSSYLPGLGAIKAGYPLKGTTSFLLNTGMLFFTGYNIYTGFYITGLVSGGMPFLKFYKGGKVLSENLAEKHNYQESQKLKSKYKKIILAL